MKKKMEKLKSMDKEELKKKLTDLREDIQALHFKSEGARSKNVKESLALRKQIARTLTFINQEN